MGMEVYAKEYEGIDKIYSPQCYGMFAHSLALISLLGLTEVTSRIKGRALKVAPLSVGAAIISNVVFTCAYTVYYNYIGPSFFLVIALIMNTISLLWVGYQLD